MLASKVRWDFRWSMFNVSCALLFRASPSCSRGVLTIIRNAMELFQTKSIEKLLLVISVRFRTSQCELYIDVDCRNLRDLFESQKHEYYNNRQREFSTDTFTKRNASIPHTLAGTYLSKIEPLRITHDQIRQVGDRMTAFLSFNWSHYFCTDVVDVLTMFKEPSLADKEQILAWRQQYSSAGRHTWHFYVLASLFFAVLHNSVKMNWD